MKIQDLLKESVTTADNSQGRPALVSLTRAVNNLIYSDIVAVQPTNQPTATLFGVKYLTSHGDQIFETSALYGGAITTDKRSSINVADLSSTYNVGDLIKSNADVVYEVVKQGQLPQSGGDLQKAINQAVMIGQIRFKPEAASADQYQNANEVISECNFSIDRWNAPVRTRKLKTDVTVELMQDMESNQLDAENLVDDVLATFISDEINKDIIQTMITVSRRYKVSGVAPDGIMDLRSDMVAPTQARTIYQYICDMAGQMQRSTSFNATWVLASARVCGLLASSGWMTFNDNPLSEGVLKNGLEVYSDATTSFDYVIVGCKHSISDLEHVGSLFYSPFTENDEAGTIKVVTDPDSLQPKLMIMARYGLSVNPYTTKVGEDQRIIQGDDWSKLVGRSKMSYMMGIMLPDEVTA